MSGHAGMFSRVTMDNTDSSSAAFMPNNTFNQAQVKCPSIFDTMRAAQGIADTQECMSSNAGLPGQELPKTKKRVEDPEPIPADEETPEEDKMRTRKRVKIKGFKDIGKDKALEDLLSICWSNSPKGKELLAKLDKVDPCIRAGGKRHRCDVDEDGDDVAERSLARKKPKNEKTTSKIINQERKSIADFKVDKELPSVIEYHHPCERSPYRVEANSTFGGLMVEIDNEPRTITYYPVDDPSDKVVHKLSLGPFMNIVDLLTKRIKLKYDYDHESIELFSELVNKSKFRPALTSKKFKMVKKYNKSKALKNEKIGGALVGSGEHEEFEASGEGLAKAKEYAKVDNDIMIMQPDDFKDGVSRFNLLLAAIKTGNTSSKLKDELKLIYNYLWTEGKKDKKKSEFFVKIIMPKYRTV